MGPWLGVGFHWDVKACRRAHTHPATSGSDAPRAAVAGGRGGVDTGAHLPADANRWMASPARFPRPAVQERRKKKDAEEKGEAIES